MAGKISRGQLPAWQRTGCQTCSENGVHPQKNNDDPLEMEATDHLFLGGDASFVDNNNQL
jgi:hypothetical protein